MRFCLAFMMQNDAHWLRLHLPVYLDSGVFDGAVALDGGSVDDSVAFVQSLGLKVYHRPFENDFGQQANTLIRACEGEGYDALMRIDPDELMFAEDMFKVRRCLEEDRNDLIALSRYHFIGDRLHWRPDWYPDSQWRAWHLCRGIGYPASLRVHEVPMPLDPHANRELFIRHHIEDAHIFHYGYTLPAAERAYKINLYEALDKGLPLPNRADFVNQPPLDIPCIAFTGEQPLNPNVIGAHAPFPEPTAPPAPPLSFKLSVDLSGDREREYGFIINHLSAPVNGNRCLDFGSGGLSTLTQAALNQGWNVTALDHEATSAPSGAQMITGDVLALALEPYDLILCCSAIEHVGLAGRYGVTEAVEDGDLRAMAKLRNALTEDGRLLLTLPIGRDHVHAPMHRVYGEDRLPLLLEGFEVFDEAYWRKLSDNSWQSCTRDEALAGYSLAVSRTDWQGCYYNLGAFELRKRR